MPTLHASTPAGVSNDTSSTTSLVTASFTPPAGALVLIKVTSADAGQTHSTPTSAGLTGITNLFNIGAAGAGSTTRASMWVARATGSATTVTAPFGGSSVPRGMKVEVWDKAILAATPNIHTNGSPTPGSGAPSDSITTVGTNSVVSWVSGDWAAINPGSPTYRSSAVQTDLHWLTGQWTHYAAYQTAASAGSQTYGLTAPGGQTYTMGAVEILDAPITISSFTMVCDASLGTTFSLDTSESPVATAVGDLVVVLYSNDFYLLSNMGTPGATGAPTMNAITGTGLPVDAGSNFGHLKGYWYVANTAGAQHITVSESGAHDEERYLAAWVLKGADTTSPVDVAAGSFNNTATSTPTAPAVSPSTVNAMAFTSVSQSPGQSGVGGPFTTPAGWVEDGDSLDPTGFDDAVFAHKQLNASGTTGTVAFTATGGTMGYVAITITIKAATGAAPASVGALLEQQGYVRLEDGTRLLLE